MNTPNPLVPQGSLQKQQGKGKSTVQIAVVSIIAVHVVFFGGLLLQGCKRENKPGDTALGATNTTLTLPPETNQQYYTSATNPPVAETAAPAPTAPAAPVSVVSTPEPIPSSPIPAPAAGEVKDYTVIRGDSYYKIAKAHGTTVSALTKANPKVDSAKLKVGQKIVIPAAGTSVAAPGTAPGNANAATAEGGAVLHVVKAGETLTRIAHQHGTTIKAIRTANGLRTDRLTVGQKLKVPAGKGTEGAKAAPGPGGATPQ